MLALNEQIHRNDTADYFPALTGVRWLAALMVFVLHYNSAPRGSVIYYIFSGGSVGVSLFFVLSGFLITHKYKNEFRLQWKWMSRYLFKRFARIYPAYFLISLLVLLLKIFYTQEQLSMNAVALHFIILQGYFEQSFAVLISPSWSLTVEEAFYLSAPLLVLLSRKISILLVFAGILAIGFGVLWLSIQSGSNDFVHTKTYLLDRTFFGRSLEFLVGAALSFYFTQKPLSGFKWITWISFLLIVGFMFLQGAQFRDYLHSPVLLWIIKLRNYIFPWLAAAFFYGLMTENTWLRRALSSSPLILLGKSSYVFYLIHLSIFATIAVRFIPGNAIALYTVLQLLSIAIYLFWEKPMHRLLLKN